jgi:DMSO/TMAO reductase YedYZ heme-binding membrane subunit
VAEPAPGLVLVGGWRRLPESHELGDGLTSLGRLTGLIASDLLLMQVLLMARIPVLEGAFGQDRLAHLHRAVGFTSFNLMLGHILLITWGYAAGKLGRIPATFWGLITDYPGMLLALAGTACLVMLVVTSIRAARARLRYESWHLLHLYAYLGVGLALPHQLWTGQELLTSKGATVFGGVCGVSPSEPCCCGGSACRCGGAPATRSGSRRLSLKRTGRSRCT